MKVETLKKIKKEFEGKPNPFLCNNSPTFKSLWDIGRNEEIIAKAREFLIVSGENSSYYIDAPALLFNSQTTSLLDDKSLRIRFLDWWIEELTKESTPK